MARSALNCGYTYPLLSILPLDIVQRIQDLSGPQCISRCAVCQNDLLWDVPITIVRATAPTAMSYCVGARGITFVQENVVFPRVFFAPITTSDARNDADVLHLDDGTDCGYIDEHLHTTPSYLHWRGMRYDNVPYMLRQSRSYTHVGMRAFCMFCTQRPRRALENWRCAARTAAMASS